MRNNTCSKDLTPGQLCQRQVLFKCLTQLFYRCSVKKVEQGNVNRRKKGRKWMFSQKGEARKKRKENEKNQPEIRGTNYLQGSQLLTMLEYASRLLDPLHNKYRNSSHTCRSEENLIYLRTIHQTHGLFSTLSQAAVASVSIKIHLTVKRTTF